MAIDYDKLMNFKIPEGTQRYTQKDTMLYALGLGFGADPVDKEQLKFVYEQGLVAMPTMCVVLAHPGQWITETGIDYVRVVHGEQGLTLHKPLPPEGNVISRAKMTAVLDKGADKGAVVYLTTELIDADKDELIAEMPRSIFARGDGGFGGPSGPAPELHEVPDGAPEKTCDIPTLPQAALIYRLSGDYNPLHADPDVATKAKYPQPILHGLCTYGCAARAVLATYCGNDPSKLVGFDVRFSSPVYPGETIQTEMWKNGNIVSFQSRIVDRDVVVIKNGKATLAG